METPRIISLSPYNIDKEHICCAIGNDAINSARARQKKEWLKRRFLEGHVFKKFDIRGKVFIEYAPAETAWSPVNAPGYMFIHCFWVSGQYKGKGYGNKLLEECLKDAGKMNGVAVVTTKKVMPFLTDKSFFTAKGFEICDQAQPYFELLVRKNKNAPDPSFRETAKKAVIEEAPGLTILYSNQCTFAEDFAALMLETGGKMGIPGKSMKIESLQQAQDFPSAFPIFSVFLDGKFITHEIMAEKKFTKLLENHI